MAYSLQPLITILEKILNPEQTRWILDDHNKPQLQSILQTAASLQLLLEKSRLPKTETSLELESQIRDAAHMAEDIIESHMVDQLLSTPEGLSFPFSTPDLPQVVQQFNSVMEQALKLTAEEKATSSGSSSSDAAPSSHYPSSKSVVVGLDEDLLRLMDRLTGVQKELEIVPIVGMGGIGKTTLARNLYQHPSVVSHFDIRAWSTVSQDPNVRAILLDLLRCIIGKDAADELVGSGEMELKNTLHRRLYSRRYVIVLDDVWSEKFWDQMRNYFPNNNNGSRIVLTTRESAVASYADSRSVQHEVQLLSKPQSWNLLTKIVFGEGECPQDLQGEGEKIASGCSGLPLAITVVGGILFNLSRSKDVWEDMANDVAAVLAGSGGSHFSNILSLSYHHLPNHLKPCFLYMGAFPEDYNIKASTLVLLWVAEGFVKSSDEENKSLEEEAEEYLKALVERNLVMVRRNKYNGKPMSCGIHDLLRDLCIRKADDERFLHVMSRAGAASELYNIRRVSVPTEDVVSVSSESMRMGLARSIICSLCQFPSFSALRLLRVLDVRGTDFEEFPMEIFQLVNLYFLAFRGYFGVPKGISRLLNLQTLISETSYFDVPGEIWELSELRHVRIDGVTWFEHDYPENFALRKLQSLYFITITDRTIESGFLKSIPNIKKLGCSIESFPPEGVDLSHLHRLEKFYCNSKSMERRRHVLGAIRFPSSLRKLSLVGLVITPTALKDLSALPNLEMLRIYKCEFVSEEVPEVWEASEEDVYRSLQVLHLGRLALVSWIVDETNFPRLRHLRLQECRKLEEIPSGFGDISTLQQIEMYGCSDSAVASAEEIVRVQESEFDNYDIKLTIS